MAGERGRSSVTDVSGQPDVLHPVPDWTPPARLSAVLRWAPVAFTLVVSLMWLEVFSWPGGPHLLVLLPMALVLLGFAAYAVVRIGGWARDRTRRVPVPALVVGTVVLGTFGATWLGLPVELRFERHRAQLDELVAGFEVDGRRGAQRPPRPMPVEVDGFGTVEVAKVPGGWHFATPSSGDRAGVPGFAHLEDPAAAAAWPEGVAIRPLGGGWYLADRPT